MAEGSATGPPGREAARLFFGPFELRTDSGELLRDGVRLPLQPQPARLLELLARRAGEVVSREEIRRHLWGEEAFVEFEQGLNFSVRRIRIALGDSASHPLFLETVPRRGYRFLAAVRNGEGAAGERRRGVPPWKSFRLAAALVIALSLLADPGERWARGTARLPPLSGAAFRAYTEGRFLAERQSPGDRERARALLEDAMLLAPRFAPAYATYARLRLDFSRPPDEVAAPAEGAARRALALSPCSNEARLVLVDIGLYFRFNWNQAKADIDRVLACDPRDAEAHRVHAAYLASHGHFEAAIEAARQAQLLDPKSEVALADLAWYSFLARRFDEALDTARRTLELEPRDSWTHTLLIEAALASRKPEIALAQANALLDIARGHHPLPLPPERIRTLRPFWDWMLRRRMVQAAEAPRSPIDLAIPALHLGETERALRLVEEAGRRKFGWGLAFLAVDPRFDALRGEPRFQRILRELGLGDVPPA